MNTDFYSAVRLTVFASIIATFLLFYLMKYKNRIAKSLIFYFSICLSLIFFKWNSQWDLGVYDAPLYNALASSVSALLHEDFLGNLPHIFLGYSAYTVPLGLIYYMFGNSQLAGQLFSTVIGLGVIYNLYHLALLCFNRRVAKFTGWIVALYPYGWVLGTTLNRDMPILLCLTLLFRVLAAVQAGYRQTSRSSDYAVGFACVVYLTFLRPPILLLCGLTLGVYLLIKKRVFRAAPDIFKPLKTVLVVLLLVAVGGSALWAKDHLSSFPLAGQAIQFTSLENLNHRLESFEDASSVYMKGKRYSSMQDILTTLPLAILYFMYSPLPWQVQNPKQALGLVDTMLLLVLTYYFCKGARFFYRHHRKFAIVLFIFLLVGFCTSSLLQSNVGAAMRHRTMFFFLMVPVAVQAFLGPRKHLEAPYFGSSPYFLQNKGRSYE